MTFKETKFFDYLGLADNMWRSKLAAAQDKFNVFFDTENDYHVNDRTIKIDQDYWEHTDCKFNCALYEAGGDWEHTIYYFRCQLKEGYADLESTAGDATDKFFCYIPNKEQGNAALIKYEEKWGPIDSDRTDVENNEKKCWTALNEYLEMLVRKEIKKVKGRKSFKTRMAKYKDVTRIKFEADAQYASDLSSLVQVFAAINRCCLIGTSRDIKFFVDGDGASVIIKDESGKIIESDKVNKLIEENDGVSPITLNSIGE